MSLSPVADSVFVPLLVPVLLMVLLVFRLVGMSASKPLPNPLRRATTHLQCNSSVGFRTSRV
jgi:hypothetical protein